MNGPMSFGPSDRDLGLDEEAPSSNEHVGFLADLISRADDRKYSDEWLGNFVRANLAEAREQAATHETEAPHAALDRWIAKWGGYVDPVTVALDELRSIAGTQKPCAEYVPPHPYLCVTCGKSRSAHSPEKSGEEPLTVSKVPQ